MTIVDLAALTPPYYTPSALSLRKMMGTLYSILSAWSRQTSDPQISTLNLMTLPPEIILCIGEHLDDTDLSSLVRTARAFADLLSPKLYDSTVGCRKTQDKTFKERALIHAGRWHSHYALDYFRTKRTDVLLRTDIQGGLLLNTIARAGNATLTSILLERGADVNAHTREQFHALTWAARGGHEEVVRILLDAGADIDVFKPGKRTLLHAVYRYGRSNPVVSQMLIDRLQERGEVSRRNSENATPLHYAVKYNRTYAVPQLIKAGADLSILDNDGFSVLDIAIKIGSTGIVKQLLDVFPGPWPSYYVQKALWEAADKLDLETLERIAPLITSRHVVANISQSQRSRAGLTALHVAARGPKDWYRSDRAFARETPEVVSRWEKMVDLLLSMGANPSAQDCRGRTPFFFAIENGNPDRLPFLLKRFGETISVRDNLGRTPLHAAVHNHKSELMVRSLLHIGLDINAQDAHGQTPLHYAATCTFTIPTLECLVDAGADSSICDKHGFPPSHFAATQRRDRALAIMLDAGVQLHKDCSLCLHKSKDWMAGSETLRMQSDLPDLIDLFIEPLI